MNTDPTLQPNPPKRRRGLLWPFLIIGLPILCFTFLLLLPERSSQQLIWLTPAQLEQSMKPGRFELLENKFRNWLGATFRLYQHNRRSILITSSLTALPALDTVVESGLGTPAYSNANGFRAWVISPAELATVRQHLQDQPGASRHLSPRIQTSEGAEARASVTRAIPVSPGVFTNVGIIVDLEAKSSASSVDLRLGVTSTRQADFDPSGSVALVTNFFAACRVLVADGGAVLIHSGDAQSADQTNYWFIASPTLLDATGKPFKR